MRGERVGVQRLTPAGKNNVWPLFIVAPKQYVGKNATKKTPAIPAPAYLAQEVMTACGQSPFFMDASGLPASANSHPIVAIANRARAIGLTLVPATRLSVPAAYQNAVASVHGADQRGVCLRVDLAQMANAAQWQPQWPFPVNQTDLVVDVADNAETAANLGNVVQQAFQQLHLGANWRSVTVAGTSMPENFQGVPSGLHLIRRYEWTLWQSLSPHTAYALHYGDYTTVPFVPPPSGIAWGFPINVRYTLDADFLICRGVPTTGFGSVDMGVQLRGHATSIRNYGNRHALGTCWADQKIDSIAAGNAPPQGLEHWVQIAVNRHIEIVRTLLP